MANYDFKVIAPAVVKKDESVKILLEQIPAASDAVSIYIIDPSGRTLTVDASTLSSIGSVTGLDAFYFRYSFASVGTYLIFAQIISTGPVTKLGAGVVHVSPWLDNIDKPISDITKSNTEISRLRTQFNRSQNSS